ncbi:MAG: SLC13 family permease [Acidaminococcus sp.]|jgi:di/tricarboxylate transporter|nr:SLC13 family permease [Acidaminococcus sp.]MCI2100324.1 SLC13 family permease [Acidaminococcus sp.]MCI2114645.1 SLC13 family permease [Acidaminococcus sp.]MCI2116703.1 SLC13 family permease [Acidaminococcus sp.]
MINIIIVISIVIAIVLGFKTKYNIGFFAMTFAYFIGCFGLGMKPKAIIALWPISTFFVIFSVGLFYNFAVVNGTMEKIAGYALYATRKFPDFLPLIIYLASVFVAALGAGFFTVMAVFCPMTLILCEKAHQNKLIGASAVNWGALSGANLMTSGSGVVFQGLIKDAGYEEQAFVMGIPLFVVTVVYPIVVLLIYILGKRLLGKGVRGSLEVPRPQPFDATQKKTLMLMALTIVLVLIFPIMHIIMPGNAVISRVNASIDIGLVCIVMSVVALFMHLGSQKAVVDKVPWNTIIMICGVGMLIKVAVKAGLIDIIGAWIGGNIPIFWLPVAFAFIGAVMSFFSSTLSVVAPALYPVVGAMCAANPALNPAVLFAAVVCGAQSSNISPFSSGGSLIQGSCQNDEERDWLFPRQIFIGVPISVGSACIATLIMSLILK